MASSKVCEQETVHKENLPNHADQKPSVPPYKHMYVYIYYVCIYIMLDSNWRVAGTLSGSCFAVFLFGRISLVWDFGITNPCVYELTLIGRCPLCKFRSLLRVTHPC